MLTSISRFIAFGVIGGKETPAKALPGFKNIGLYSLRSQANGCG